MIKAGVIGAAGYTAGELIRILLHHPEVEIKSLVSQSHAGKPVYEAHPDLRGDIHLTFEKHLSQDVHVVFLCSGHGHSRNIVAEGSIPTSAKVIDLSSDHRIQDHTHTFVYGLPELNRDAISRSSNIANPGCFATCIQLSVLPLAAAECLQEDLHVTAITGSTGAGQNPSSTTHFSWRSNNASIYKAHSHQHVDEMKQSLKQLQPGFGKHIHFIPIRGAFTRGILSASYLKTDLSLKDANGLYEDYYQDHPFVHLTNTSPDIKQVAGTNKVLLHVQKQNGQILITGVIDNLVKGASGQAIQNMNLQFGFNETKGLTLKTMAF